ncbi:hypothetical protein B5F82_00345 [Megamonas hypermegale]|uniref:hypothetical protein n=1 Tax=Megamonas hypermegale TaxID=158847 RepID=UPI000B3A98EB|nr:hypothetical protein [Megamonas hypermegale]OUO41667.1 hypothetical protein B5F82_00345 [Megamonas hypermegale]
MKKVYKYFCIISATLLYFSSAVFAENVEWKNKGVDFSAAQTVYIDPNIEYYPGTILFDVDKANVANAIKENKKQLKKYKIVSNKEMADFVIVPSIVEWSSRDEYVPQKSEVKWTTVVDYEDEYGNKAYSKYPELSVSGGYRKYIQFFTVKFTVYDKDNYTAYVYVDRREDEKENKNMFERAVKNFFKEFNKTK